MAETIQIGEIKIAMARKDIKHVHLSVHPPTGRVTLVAPKATRPEVARAELNELPLASESWKV